MTGKKAAQKFCYKCGSGIPPGCTYCRVCGYGGKQVDIEATK